MLRKMQQRVFYYSRKTLMDHFSLMTHFQSLNKAFEKIPIDGKAPNVFNFGECFHAELHQHFVL